MLTRLENILTFQRYEKWKVEEKLGSKAHPCYIRIRVITNRVISRFKCITAFHKNQATAAKIKRKCVPKYAKLPKKNKILAFYALFFYFCAISVFCGRPTLGNSI